MVSDNDCAELDRLVRNAKAATELDDDPIGDLARQIRELIASVDDPYLLAGVLAEGAIQTIVQRIPAGRRVTTTRALMQLLVDRLRADGSPAWDPSEAKMS